MKIELEIKTINISDDINDGYKMISFGDNETEENIENYVIIQRANTFDSQDKELGMDNYYIEYNDQSNSGYGICEKIVLDNDILDFVFAVKKEEDISNIVLKLDSQKYDKEKLINYLKIILGDSFEIKN
jgi:Immunity protein 10